MITLATVLLLCIAPKGAVAEQIQNNDQLTVRVSEWRTVDGELRDWSAFSGTYTVGQEGTVNFPFVGQIAAGGLSEEELSDVLSEALSNRFALVEPLQATVTRNDLRMVIVGGAVLNPGEVAFHTNMTARHAIAMAGGGRSTSLSGVQGRIEWLNAQSQLSVLEGRENVLLARAARLRAERDGLATLVTPASASAAIEDVIASEQAALDLTRSRRERELALLEGRIEILNAEIEALGEKQVSLERQRTLAAEDKSTIEELSGRGLAVNARVLDANRTLATVETQILDVMTAILRARQNLASARSERLQLVDGAAAVVLKDLLAVEAELSEVQTRRATQDAIVQLLSSDAGGDPEMPFQVSIHRRTKGATEIVRDAIDLPLLPGDLVEVLLPPQQGRG